MGVSSFSFWRTAIGEPFRPERATIGRIGGSEWRPPTLPWPLFGEVLRSPAAPVGPAREFEE
jgi:hypothetical protein